MQVLPERICTQDVLRFIKRKLEFSCIGSCKLSKLVFTTSASKSLIFKMIQQPVSTSWTLSPALPSSMTKVRALFVTLPESSIGLYSRSQHNYQSKIFFISCSKYWGITLNYIKLYYLFKDSSRIKSCEFSAQLSCVYLIKLYSFFSGQQVISIVAR